MRTFIFPLGPQNLVCVFCSQHISTWTPCISSINTHMCPVAAILDGTALGHDHLGSNSISVANERLHRIPAAISFLFCKVEKTTGPT